MKRPMNRFLIAGYGGKGARHARDIRESGFAEVAGILETEPGRLADARRQGFFASDSLEEVMDRDADCALVVTPNDTHAALVRALLESGRHVLVEKPAARNVGELRDMYAAADRSGRLLSVCMNRRWDPDFLAVNHAIGAGALGEILCFESRIHGSRGIPEGWRREMSRGGGMLYDWGVHLVDQALAAFDFRMPGRVRCELSHALAYDADDGFCLEMTFERGVRAYIEVGTCNFIAMPRFYVCGRRGAALIDDWRGPIRLAECLAWEEAEGEARLMSRRDAATVREYHRELAKPSPGEVLRNFCFAVRGEEPLRVRRDEVEKVTRIIDAAFASAASGLPVAVEEA